MQFIDLAAQQRRLKDGIDGAIQTVLAHGQYIMGPEVGKLEEALAAFTGTTHAVGCSSGTDALLMALMAYDVGPGDAVFTTPFTFIATAEVISLLGAVPVFVDIDPRTFNIDARKLDQAVHALTAQDGKLHPLPRDRAGRVRSLTPRGIIPVDLFGQPADYDDLNAVARRHGLFVIEDAAQSLGATYRGRPAGSLGDVACTSFFPAKPLGCYGDGGMCFTDDDAVAQRLRSIRVHGQGKDRYDNVRIGINGRLDSLQAAVLLAKLPIFPEEIGLRQEAADRYNRLIGNGMTASGNGRVLELPAVSPDRTSVWAQYSLLARNEDHRRNCMDSLTSVGIPSVIYYPVPLHLQTAYASLGYGQGEFPLSEGISERIFSLPMHPYLAPEDQEAIAALLTDGDVPDASKHFPNR